jgi:tRNA (cmo5U34)-methyltransferase
MTEFSFDTIRDFDEHIKLSIPNYDILAESIVNLSRYFTIDGTAVIDLGCSTGRILEAIPHDGKKLGLDNSSNLLPHSHDNVHYLNEDITTFDEYDESSLVLSIFTLQFIDRMNRKKILDRIFASLVGGGALIIAEKTMAKTGFGQEMLNFAHYDHKLKSFTPKQVLEKERTLRKLMRCNTQEENEELVTSVGFDKGVMFWKFFGFEGSIYRKPLNY